MSFANAWKDLIDRIANAVPFATNTRGKYVNYGPFKSPDEYYTDWPNAMVA